MIHVCDIVEYGLDSFGRMPQTWRVTHHLKRVEDHLDNWKPKGIGDEIVKCICLREREEERQRRKKVGSSYKLRYRLVYCRPKEATHVELVSICGDIAPISKCKKIGVVNWSKKDIKRDREDAVKPFWLKNDFFPIWEWE